MDLLSTCVIAIDGPAGSGKSTTAQALAERFSLLYVDTGAMYRALTWAALQAGIPTDAGDDLVDQLRTANLELRSAKRDQSVLWNGQDITEAVRTPAVDAAVSTVSSHAAVRENMVERQRELGRNRGVVMEGRDIGSVVFPLATVKIYLDASLEARVHRRYRQYRLAGQEVDRALIRDELAARDKRDSERSESPLTISPDACVLETSRWSLQEQIECAARTVRILVAERCRTAAAAALPDGYLSLKYRWAYSGFEALAQFYGVRRIYMEGAGVVKGCIIACNHISWWDPPLAGSVLTRWPVNTLAKAELFRYPPLSTFIRYLDTIPIQRSGYDRQAFSAAVASLDRGNNVFIFPEGTRRPICKPGPVRSGLGILLQATSAPLQPVFVRGTCHLEPGGSRVSPPEVRVGPLVRMHGLPTLCQLYDRKNVTERIARFCNAIFWELQARSFAEHPPTDWELAESERQDRAYKAKFKHLFGHRQTHGRQLAGSG